MLRLSGISPFLGDNDEQTLANVCDAHFSLDRPEFDLISPLAKDFLKKLLVKDPT
jgi:myosin-light-chain kinase